jgi:hypothetical protein
MTGRSAAVSKGRSLATPFSPPRLRLWRAKAPYYEVEEGEVEEAEVEEAEDEALPLAVIGRVPVVWPRSGSSTALPAAATW